MGRRKVYKLCPRIWKSRSRFAFPHCLKLIFYIIVFYYCILFFIHHLAPSLDALQGELDQNNFFFNEEQISINFKVNKTKKKKVSADEDEDEDDQEEDLDDSPAEFVLAHTGTEYFYHYLFVIE